MVARIARIVVLAGALLWAPACHDDNAPVEARVTIDVAAINALVPAPLKDRFVFEQREIVIAWKSTRTGAPIKEVYTLAAPKSWERVPHDELHVSLEPHPIGDLMVIELVDPPATEHDKQAMASRFEQGKVITDDRRQDGRSAILYEEAVEPLPGHQGHPSTTRVRALAHTDTPRQIWCSVDLTEDDKGAAPAFEQACNTAVGVSSGE